MLEVLKVIILGIVQGITEWLPISSTGHLILVEQLIQLKQSEAFTNMFNVVIQFGSIMAVVVIYFHKLNPFSPTKTEKQKKMTIQLWIKVVIGTIPDRSLPNDGDDPWDIQIRSNNRRSTGTWGFKRCGSRIYILPGNSGYVRSKCTEVI